MISLGKWLVCVDEMISDGIIENMDSDSVLKLSKLRWRKDYFWH